VIVWETGLGGRLDATNVVRPLVSVITNVSLDHMHILGSTVAEIAAEKAGIIKPGIPVVTAAEGEALEVIARRAQKQGCALYVYGRDFSIRRTEYDWEGQTFTYNGIHSVWKDVSISMLGAHQCTNAGVALAVMEVLSAQGVFSGEEQALREGLLRTQWAGRLERIGKKPTILLDGAHNPDGARALAQALRELLHGQRLIVVLGILADKVVPDVITPWLPLADEIIVTEPDTPRSADAQEVARLIERLCAEESTRDTEGFPPVAGRRASAAVPLTIERNVTRACKQACTLAGEEDVVLVTGSLYTISEARRVLLTDERASHSRPFS
jgi:dihydrofolate synthase / folylpolyglutamate synthase